MNREELQTQVVELSRRIRRFELLKSVLDELHQIQHIQSVFQDIYDVFPRYLNIHRVSLLLYDEKTDSLVSDELIGVQHRDEELHSAPQLSGSSISGKCFTENRPIVVNDCDASDLIPRKYVEQLRLKSSVAVPLTCKRGAIGVFRIDDTEEKNSFTDQDVEFFQMLGQILGTAIENARLYTQAREAEENLRELNEELEQRVRARTRELRAEVREREAAYARIRDDLETAASVQFSMLPQRPPDLGNVHFKWVFDSCDEVAGDMFNIHRLDEKHVAFYVLDVTGHGVQAALFSVTIDRVISGTTLGTGLLKSPLQQPPYYKLSTPAEIATGLNRRFPMSPEVGRFFTIALMILNTETLELVCTLAGHQPPVLFRDGKATRLTYEPGPAIGITKNPVYTNQTLQLKQGDALIVHTDGVEEAFNERQEEFGEKRVMEVMTHCANDPVEETVECLHKSVKDFAGGADQNDDITIVGIRIG